MVASSQEPASRAGLEVLRAGGNAADAAVAVAAALAVCEPNSTGPGGDAFCLYYQAETRRVFSLNGSGRSPAALTLERVHGLGFTDRLPAIHPDTVTVPGAVAAWFDLLQRFGRLPAEQVFAPAIHIAEDGFIPGQLNSYYWRKAWHSLLVGRPGAGELHLPEQGPFRNPGLARTLNMLAQRGPNAFYRGEIGQSIVDALTTAGGCMTLADLGDHESEWSEPLYVDYDGVLLWECGPNSQGLVALQALEILKHTSISQTSALDADRLHTLIEALKLAFRDAQQNLADPAFKPADTSAWISPDYNRRLAGGIDPRRARNIESISASHFTGTDTVYFCVVDGEGNACSMVNSNYIQFGSGIIPAGWGFSLQNRGLGFSLDPAHPNALGPGKRPYHTIIPAMLTRSADDSLVAALGVMGGSMQPQGHLQVLLHLLLDEMDPQEALDAPRFCLDIESPDGRVWVEEGMPMETIRELNARGHRVELLTGYKRSIFGRGQVIRILNDGSRTAGSDHRADGCALAE